MARGPVCREQLLKRIVVAGLVAVLLATAPALPGPGPAWAATAPQQAQRHGVGAGTPGNAAGVEEALLHTPVQRTYVLYTVRPGDTVEGIARRFHDVAWLIRRRNGGLWSLAPGQKIQVWRWPFDAPYYVTHTVVTDRPQYYTVRPGDTLMAIAQTLHTSVATLAGENGLGDENLIYPGQRLVLHHYTVHQSRVLVPGVPVSRLHTGLLLTDVANLTGFDAALIKAVAWHETGWTMVRGASGEIGMMQIMPDMAAWVQRALIGYDLDPTVPVNNALEGTLLLGYYLDITHHDIHKALALYHSGDTLPSARNGVYIRAVMALRDWFYHHPSAGF